MMRSCARRRREARAICCALLALLSLAVAVSVVGCRRPGLPKVGSKLPEATITAMGDGGSLALPEGLDGRPAMIGFWSPG